MSVAPATFLSARTTPLGVTVGPVVPGPPTALARACLAAAGLLLGLGLGFRLGLGLLSWPWPRPSSPRPPCGSTGCWFSTSHARSPCRRRETAGPRCPGPHPCRARPGRSNPAGSRRRCPGSDARRRCRDRGPWPRGCRGRDLCQGYGNPNDDDEAEHDGDQTVTHGDFLSMRERSVQYTTADASRGMSCLRLILDFVAAGTVGAGGHREALRLFVCRQRAERRFRHVLARGLDLGDEPTAAGLLETERLAFDPVGECRLNRDPAPPGRSPSGSGAKIAWLLRARPARRRRRAKASRPISSASRVETIVATARRTPRDTRRHHPPAHRRASPRCRPSHLAVRPYSGIAESWNPESVCVPLAASPRRA